MRNPIHLFLLSSVLVCSCASSPKHDGTFAGPGGDQPLRLPARITLFAPSKVTVAEPKLEQQVLTRGNEVEADSFAAGISRVLESKGIKVDLRRFPENARPETSDLDSMVSAICEKDTSRHSLVIGTLRLATDAELSTDRTLDSYQANPKWSQRPTAKQTTTDRPVLMTEIHLYDHMRSKVSRSLRFSSETSVKKDQPNEPAIPGADPMMKFIFKQFADTVSVR